MNPLSRVRTLAFPILALITTGCPAGDDDAYSNVQVDFATKQEVTDGQVIVIQNSTVDFMETTSSNVTFLQWDFEGGTPISATGSSPNVAYENTGAFDVTLTANGGAPNEKVVTKIEYVVVLAPENIEASIVSEVGSNGNATTWVYDANDRPISSETLGTGGASVSRTTYQWDDGSGEVEVIEHFDADDNLVGTEYNYYDENDELEGREVMDADGNPVQILDYTYTADLITGADIQQSDGQGGLLSLQAEYVRDFDNNLFTEIYKDPGTGNLVGQIEYTFDEFALNPYFDMGIEPFPFTEFQYAIEKYEILDAQSNPISTTTANFNEVDQYGMPVDEERTTDGNTEGFVRVFRYNFDF